MPYYGIDKRPIDYPVDKKNDDDDDDNDNDDDDDKRGLYKQLEDLKKELKDKGHLDESIDEECNRIFRALWD